MKLSCSWLAYQSIHFTQAPLGGGGFADLSFGRQTGIEWDIPLLGFCPSRAKFPVWAYPGIM